MRGAAAAPAALLALLAPLAGCGGAAHPAETPPPPPPEGTGYFAGSGEGVGATLDLLGDDPVSRAAARALLAAARPGDPGFAVGIASIVNDTATGFPAPRFVAVLQDGRAVALTPALDALARVRGPAARAARARLRAAPSRVPSRGAATAYLVLRGASADRVASVRMAAGARPTITLTARRR